MIQNTQMSARVIFSLWMGAAGLAAAEPLARETNAPVRQISEHVFEIGEVLLNKQERSVSFPAAVNMNEGLVEYFCVAGQEKLHESLLKTAVFPMHVHLAALLVSEPGQIPEPGEFPATAPREGSPVAVQISWVEGGIPKTAPAETFIWKETEARTLPEGSWRYISSQRHGKTFMAQQAGNIMAVMWEPSALMNIADEDRANDEIWRSNPRVVPAVETEVRVTLRFPPFDSGPRPMNEGKNQSEE